MNQKLSRLSRRYATALQQHLQQGLQASLQPALALGRQAVSIGLETLDLARIHEATLATLSAANGRAANGKQAARFFAEALGPIEQTHGAALQTEADLQVLHRKLGRRAVEVASSDRELGRGVAQRKAAEAALKKSGTHCTKLLTESRRLQIHLRRLTHRKLRAQEDQRAKISRELHDEIAQTLLGINVRLLALKTEARLNAKGLQKEIASTQRLVEKSARTMSRFARDFGKQHDA